MTRDIRRRLEKLESQVARQPTELDKGRLQLHQFLQLAVAYYLGDPAPDEGPDESIMDAYMRALGYPNSYEYIKAFDANDEDFNRRRCEANEKLLAKFGVSWEHEGHAIRDAFKRMEAGFSERQHYKRRWHEIVTGSHA